MDRTSILAAANNAVKSRGENYGSPLENFSRIARLWNGYMDDRPIRFDEQDVGIMMMLLKISRLMESPTHEDSWVDIAGYSAITAEAMTEREEV